MPFQFRTQNPTVFPSHVFLEAVPDPYNYFSHWVVEDGVTFVYLDADRGYMKRPIPAEETANSVVEDYIASMIYADPACHPGIFWVPGELKQADIERLHGQKLKEVRAIQDQWFTRIVEAADDEWARAKHHRSIAPVQKLAAKCLGMEKEWTVQVNYNAGVVFVKCPACMSLIDNKAIVCGTCRCVVNAEAYSKLQFAQAPVSASLQAQQVTVK